MTTNKFRKAINKIVRENKLVTVTTVLNAHYTKKYRSTLSDSEINTIKKEVRKNIENWKKEEATKARIKREKNQPPIKEIHISIDWIRSTMWGFNPHAHASVIYKDGTYDNFYASASGCGYDKESTVIAEILDLCLKYKLWNIKPSTLKQWQDAKTGGSNWEARNIIPYGIGLNYPNENRYFEGGVGVSCYYEIIKFLGGKMIKTGGSKRFDSYMITFR